MRKNLLTIVLIALICTGLAAANVSSQPYGINVHKVTNDVLQKAKDAGIKWIRTEAFWFEIETQQGVYNWQELDRVINYAHNNGLSILLIVGYTPNWANNNKGFKYPADNLAHWQNFVRLCVNRYSDKVKYWNIWNEPNSPDFFIGGKDEFVNKIFIPAAQSIKNTDPGAFIVGPELAHLTGTGAEWYFWMKYILTWAGEYVDIVSHHIYKDEGVSYIYDLLEIGEHLIPSVKEILQETGHDDLPFWITETGWNTFEFSDDEQATLYRQFLQERQNRNYPAKLFFYEIIDDVNPDIPPWGILRSDKTEKPAYTTYEDFISGKIDGGGDDGGTDVGNNKQCFSQASLEGSGSPANYLALTQLRRFRDRFRELSPSAGYMVLLYYKLSDQFKTIALQDSRVFKLGRQILTEFAKSCGKQNYNLSQIRLTPGTVEKCRQLAALLKQKKLSPSTRNIINWGERQLYALGKIPIEKYIRLSPNSNNNDEDDGNKNNLAYLPAKKRNEKRK